MRTLRQKVEKVELVEIIISVEKIVLVAPVADKDQLVKPKRICSKPVEKGYLLLRKGGL